MDELWVLHPTHNTTGRALRPMLKWRRSGTIRPMKEMTTEEFEKLKVDFREALRERIIRVRKAMPTPDGNEYSRKQMAKALGVKPNTYAGYEGEKKTKNSFPFALLPRFCEVTHQDPWTMLTDQGAGLSPAKRKTR